jgi:hypothetical protein
MGIQLATLTLVCVTCCMLLETVWGECGHAFHMQCIMKWLQAQQNVKQDCPMCRQPWKFRAG